MLVQLDGGQSRERPGVPDHFLPRSKLTTALMGCVNTARPAFQPLGPMLLTLLTETTACPVSSPAVFSSYTSSAFSTPLSRLLSSYLLIPPFRFLLFFLYICLFHFIFILFRPDVAGMLDRNQAHTQLVREYSATVVSTR